MKSKEIDWTEDWFEEDEHEHELIGKSFIYVLGTSGNTYNIHGVRLDNSNEEIIEYNHFRENEYKTGSMRLNSFNDCINHGSYKFV